MALYQTQKIIVPSNFTFQELTGFNASLDEKIIIIPEAVWRADYKWEGEESPYLIFIGTIEPRKNLSHLIKAMGVLKKTYKQDINLVVCGKRGWLQDNLVALVEDENVQDTIDFKGYVTEEEKERLLIHSRCLVNPSYYEGFGLQVLEAMSLGVPVAVSRDTCLADLVQGFGVTFNPKDPIDIAEKLDNLMTDKGLLKKVSLKGHEKSKEFDIIKQAEETFQVYATLKKPN